jgi:hypothetical protein
MENQNLVRSTRHAATITEAEARRRLAACYRLLLSLRPREQGDSGGTEHVDAAQAAPDGTLSHE